MWQHLLLGVGSPSGTTRAQPQKHNSNAFLPPLSLHIGIRQGAALLEIGDLEAVASPEGLTTTGWVNPDIFARFVFYTE